ncbi:phosphoenolpyruvate carboxykinase [Egicoccus halophilus]|uniref:phosphoenolpyruvate carboxykinase (ATP) n=1 Tax=Egicoccus halophilus TaxID=1670830 RepID=A0A8J3AAQ2_9ACTN|nr:phosphoenolpyruvate carboxykinase [Egicoccus halophilus]GGI09027.1 phosphoenolpyruvate carboxykinase [ATP] 1 [Egicoccus halophilus]
MPFALPNATSVTANPTQAELREWVLEFMPRVTETEFGNLNYQARILARLTPSTFFVSDAPTGKQVMARDEAEQWAAKQDAYVAEQDMVLMEGYIGPDPAFRTGTRLFMEKSNSNVPAMQQQLYFPRDEDWTPEFTVIYTPGLRVPEHHEECLILVDLDNYVTRVMGSDYFGESKMGGLRMWNKLVYDRGGLAMHSGAKTFPAESTADGAERLALIIGLSGTGKTTTTFRNVKGSLPVQDDFIALMPGGTVHTTENGCFAKSFGLDPDDEPTIYGGATRPDAWLESVAVDPETGKVDFFDDSYTANGRVTFPLENIRHRDPRDLPKAHYLFILNRNENLIPAVAKLKPEQAAYYFMLGETKGTSAGGAHEAGKNLRVPGTNPFWFEEESSMGNRFLELLETCELEVYLFNTGRVGGPDDDERSKKVRIPHSAAVQEAIVDGTIEWEEDPDFGYLVASSLPGIDDDELLQPRKLYERQGRMDEYRALVERLATERAEYLAKFTSLDQSIVKAG